MITKRPSHLRVLIEIPFYFLAVQVYCHKEEVRESEAYVAEVYHF